MFSNVVQRIMENHIIKKHLLNFESGSSTDFQRKANLNEESLMLTDTVDTNSCEDDSLRDSGQYVSGNEFRYDVHDASEKSTEIPQRKSVICSIKDFVNVAPLRDESDAGDSSAGSSLVMEGDSDDPSKEVGFLDTLSHEPSADPSEIECVITDTSGDESDDVDESDSDDEKNAKSDSKSGMDQLSCSVCEYVVMDGDRRKELLKHMQASHKFSVRGSGHSNVKDATSATNNTSKEKNRQKKDYICSKTHGGCGSLFFSQKGLLAHHIRSKSAGSSCWVISDF